MIVNIHCGYSREASQWVGSNEQPQYILGANIWTVLQKLSQYLFDALLWCSFRSCLVGAWSPFCHVLFCCMLFTTSGKGVCHFPLVILCLPHCLGNFDCGTSCERNDVMSKITLNWPSFASVGRFHSSWSTQPSCESYIHSIKILIRLDINQLMSLFYGMGTLTLDLFLTIYRWWFGSG